MQAATTPLTVINRGSPWERAECSLGKKKKKKKSPLAQLPPKTSVAFVSPSRPAWCDPVPAGPLLAPQIDISRITEPLRGLKS